VLDAELWMDGRLQRDKIDPVVWAQTAARGVFTMFTDGLVAHEPRCVVRVRHRRSSAVVMEHHWDTNADAAVRDHLSITEALRGMSLEAFAREYGIDLEA
jgi:hypothetical protein